MVFSGLAVVVVVPKMWASLWSRIRLIYLLRREGVTGDGDDLPARVERIMCV